jgi:hypothetical protein
LCGNREVFPVSLFLFTIDFHQYVF